jgi:hypothetical protein
MKKFKWAAYGLDMTFDFVIIETEGETIGESHDKAVELFNQNKVDFDTVEMVDLDFLRRADFLRNESLSGDDKLLDKRYRVYDDRAGKALYMSNSRGACASYIDLVIAEDSSAFHYVWFGDNPDYMEDAKEK